MREVLVKTEEFKDSPVGKIPKDWEVYSLAGVTQYITYGFTNPMPTTKDGPWMITALDIANGIIHYQQARHTSEKAYKNDLTQKSKPQIGDILITKDGTLGRIAVVDRTDICINQSVACLRPLPDTDIKFLVHYLSSAQGQDKMLADAGGSTIKHLYITKIAKMEVPVPPTEERRKIVEILDTVDEAIAHTSSLITKLKQTKAGLLQDLLTRGLDEDSKLRDPHAHPEQFKDSPLGRIPTDWEVHPLKSKQNPNYPYIKTGPFGSSLKGEHWVEQGVPVITIGAIGEGEFIISELLFISEAKAKTLSTYAVKEGDLVFSRVADVGRSVVVSKPQEGWIMSSNLMRISLDQYLVEPIFAYLNIVDNNLTRQQIRQFVNSGGREIANTAILDSLQFCWTSKEEQIRIIQVAKTYDTRIRAEEAYLNKLKLQKQGLMQDLLTAKVRVNTIK